MFASVYRTGPATKDVGVERAKTALLMNLTSIAPFRDRGLPAAGF